MEQKTFMKTYKALVNNKFSDHFCELETAIFNSMIEILDNDEEYSEVIVLHDAYLKNQLEFSEINYQTQQIEISGMKIQKKSLRKFLRYLQITCSLFGLTSVLPESIHHDFHIFGTLVRGERIFPYIPDHSQYLLMSSNIVKAIVKQVVLGYDPEDTIIKAQSQQQEDVNYLESTVAFLFHVHAIAYTTGRLNNKLPLETHQINNTINNASASSVMVIDDKYDIKLEETVYHNH
uniref:p6b n=1 Tax=Emaravirus rosae TaxID=1980433 RepID=A0A6M4NJJ4_9VIRU|nr:p6b [Emaravirus rosae]